jgi:SAM-dependent methyltransferase
MSTTEHWNAVYARKAPNEVSWFQAEATASIALIEACRVQHSAAILDVGAGASTLVDGLLARGYADITLLDIAANALAATRARLPSAPIHFEVADITSWQPPRQFDVWHDRAVFHFLTQASDRLAYRAALLRAVPAAGHVIIGTFADDGPERCSGLPVQRYSAQALAQEFVGALRPVESRALRHVTPGGSEQSFIFLRFERV